MLFDGDMPSRIFFSSIFLVIVPGPSSHEQRKSSPSQQCVDSLFFTCMDVLIMVVLAMFLSFQKCNIIFLTASNFPGFSDQNFGDSS